MLTPYRPTPSPDHEQVRAAALYAEESGASGEAQVEGVNWGRILAALRRSKWLMAAIVGCGVGLGVLITRLGTPEYLVGATIVITEQSGRGGNGGGDRGPIRANALLESTAWIELLRSYAVVDPVVRRLGLYVVPAAAGDASLFANVTMVGDLRPGRYQLVIDAAARQYKLKAGDAIVESGRIGDSLGRSIGLAWAPNPQLLAQRSEITFDVITPREASQMLNRSLITILPEESNFLRLQLVGTNPQVMTPILNEWIREFTTVAADMKRAKHSELTRILGVQLVYAESLLRRNEVALENFRVHTITLPAEGSPVAAGIEATRDPVMQNFFTDKIAFDNVRRDRDALLRLLQDQKGGRISAESFFALPQVLTQAPALRVALEELQNKEAQLRAARQFYTEEHKTVRDLRVAVEVLQTQTIPRAASQALENLQRRESDLGDRIQSASQELRQIPARTIEEMGLRREVTVAENLYRTLQSRYAEAQLAEASATPDLAVLDSAVAPKHPQDGKTWRLVLMAILGSIGAAVSLAIVLDRVDRRFRYPEQATNELHLPILGTVPALRTKRQSADVVAEAQMLESFRALRLQLQHLNGRESLAITVSSPGSGDGKSLLAANLALSFADAGYRTLLIDGDIRRGSQHTVFGAAVKPGLLDTLTGQVSHEQILQPTTHAKLTLVARGTRVPDGPELLASWSMADLLTQLRPRFDAIVIDSAPLGAGIDPLALAVQTGNMLVVLRVGETDRKLARAKLDAIRNLPIRVLGAVLNDVRAVGIYRYYAYEYNEPKPSVRAPLRSRVEVRAAP